MMLNSHIGILEDRRIIEYPVLEETLGVSASHLRHENPLYIKQL